MIQGQFYQRFYAGMESNGESEKPYKKKKVQDLSYGNLKDL